MPSKAFRQHNQVNPLESPGTADLTADVDFTYLYDAVKDKAVTFGPVSQYQFLKDMGIDSRLEVCQFLAYLSLVFLSSHKPYKPCFCLGLDGGVF